jgi:hypothetical protein
MKTEEDTIFSYGNNVKYSPNDGANNVSFYSKLNKQIGQELSKMEYFDDLTNKDKQPLTAQATNPSTS